MNLLPMNGSQTHSIEYQLGLRDDVWVYQLPDVISIDPGNITGMIQDAILNMAEHERYMLAVKKWLGGGAMVEVECPANLLPNIPISHRDPFGGGMYGGSRYFKFPEFQDLAGQQSIVRKQFAFLWLSHNWRYIKNDKSSVKITDDFLVAESEARDFDGKEIYREDVILGKNTTINCSFGIGEDYSVEDVAVIVRAYGGLEKPAQYAETMVRKVLFEKAEV